MKFQTLTFLLLTNIDLFSKNEYTYNRKQKQGDVEMSKLLSDVIKSTYKDVKLNDSDLLEVKKIVKNILEQKNS